LRNQKKKMLKLPIKSFSLEIDSGKPSTSSSSTNNNNSTTIFDSPSTKAKKYMGGLQLTPLMSKLTLLAMNENENLASSFTNTNVDMTPSYYDTPVDNANKSLFSRIAKVDEENIELQQSSEMKRVDLFIIGHQNMSLLVLADENLCNQQMVQQMFEITVNRLSRLEQKLNDVINVTVDLKANDYSFVEFDKSWHVLQRGGSYDLQSTLLMHDNFTDNRNVSDIIVRTNDSIIYGHNSGESEVYYQHAAKQQNGFPAPSEFTIISQAKRKLERDQSVVLF
jgi:Hermansky-Pudlak syndrome 4 protein